MNVTLSLDDELVEKVNKIAGAQDTTLTGIVRTYLESLTSESLDLDREQRERLHETFEKFHGTLGEKTWTRDDLYDRP